MKAYLVEFTEQDERFDPCRGTIREPITWQGILMPNSNPESRTLIRDNGAGNVYFEKVKDNFSCKVLREIEICVSFAIDVENMLALVPVVERTKRQCKELLRNTQTDTA